jgi:hypothetical protein
MQKQRLANHCITPTCSTPIRIHDGIVRPSICNATQPQSGPVNAAQPGPYSVHCWPVLLLFVVSVSMGNQARETLLATQVFFCCYRRWACRAAVSSHLTVGSLQANSLAAVLPCTTLSHVAQGRCQHAPPPLPRLEPASASGAAAAALSSGLAFCTLSRPRELRAIVVFLAGSPCLLIILYIHTFQP